MSMSSESSGINYGKSDSASRLLWASQRTKVNPWEGRGTQAETESDREDKEPPAAPQATERTPTLIAQDDVLRFESQEALENPFLVLLQRSFAAGPQRPSS